MSDLRPCAGCRRHVSVTETACPFCGAPCEAEPVPTLRFGRISRAAMFAGAALASSACGGKKPPPETALTVEHNEEERAAQADAGVAESAPAPADAGMAPVAVPHNVKMPYGAPPMRRRVV